MAKTKKSRDRKPRVEKPNPFDLKFANKKNMTAKGARRYLPVGKPSAARSKAMEKREKTIGIEYRRQGCVNQIVDHRIAERSNVLNEEEKASLRFAAQKKKQIGKRNIFNLDEPKEKDNNGDDDDDYVFTHKGKSLSEVQRYERGEEDDNNELDGDVVALANFGGEGLDVKVTNEEGITTKYSRKDVINEVISNSKNAKYIRQMAKDDITLATENIDEKFKLMKSQGLMDKLKDVQSKSGNKRVLEDYDEIYQTLLADGGRKAMPTLSEKEKAEREAKRLAELEKERLKRMQSDSDESDNEKGGGVDEEVKTTKKQKKKVSFKVAYDEDGNLLTHFEKPKESDRHIGVDEEVDDFYADDDAEDDDEMGDAEDEDEEMDDEEVAEDDEEDEEGDIVENDDEEIEEDEHDASLNLKTRTKTSKDSTSDIPFTFPMPKKYSSFRDLYSGYFPDQWQIVTERLIKCYHPSLNPKNKKLIAYLFRYGLRFYDALAKNHAVEQLQPMLNVLRQFQALNKPAAAGITRSLLIYKRNHYRPAGKVVSRPPPTFDLIAFFTLVAELYPTSDHYHPVCSPTFTFAVEVLRFSQINSIKSCGIVILLAKILMKWVQESQRYIPEVINVTRLLLNLAVKKEKGDFLLDPFAYRNVSRKNGGIDLLIVKEKLKSAKELETLLNSLELFNSEDTVSEQYIRMHLLLSLFSVIDLTVDVYDRLKLAFGAIFTPQLQFLLRIDETNYPSELSKMLNDLTKKISDKITEYNPRQNRQRKEIKKIKMIKMLDPVIDEDFDSEKPHRSARKKDPDSEVKRLKKLVRNEKRGALKELRLDAQYISAAQQKKNEEVRTERNYKTKRIISSLQGQESEYKKRKMKKF